MTKCRNTLRDLPSAWKGDSKNLPLLITFAVCANCFHLSNSTFRSSLSRFLISLYQTHGSISSAALHFIAQDNRLGNFLHGLSPLPAFSLQGEIRNLFGDVQVAL